MNLAPGLALGRYTLEERIGRGRAGEVWRARDPRLEREFAIKILPSSGAGDLRHVRATVELAHENCVPLYEVDEIDDKVLVVMGLVPGRAMSTYLGDASLPMSIRFQWLAGIARALGTAHSVGIVHRNVSPANVLITRDGLARLGDFGVGKPPPEYTAPEQTDAYADARSDQYSFGILAYELLAGVHPDGKRVARRRVRAYAPDISADFADAIHKMMSPTPSDRHASITDATVALELAVQMLSLAEPTKWHFSVAPPSTQPPIPPSTSSSSPSLTPSVPSSSRNSIPSSSSRHSIPPKNADARALALADALTTFAGDPKGEGGYLMEVRATEKATHPLVLVPREATYGALVAGSVSFDTRSAQIRAFDYLELLHTERRTGKPFLDRASYDAIVAGVQALLRLHGVSSFAIVPAPAGLRESVMRPRSLPPSRR